MAKTKRKLSARQKQVLARGRAKLKAIRAAAERARGYPKGYKRNQPKKKRKVIPAAHRFKKKTTRRNPARKLDAKRLAAMGLYYDTWTPGDGVARYRFFTKPSDYFAGDGIYTALGLKEAECFISGWQRRHFKRPGNPRNSTRNPRRETLYVVRGVEKRGNKAGLYTGAERLTHEIAEAAQYKSKKQADKLKRHLAGRFKGFTWTVIKSTTTYQ